MDENAADAGDFTRVENAVGFKDDGDAVTLTVGGEAQTAYVGLVTLTVGGKAKKNDVGLVTLTVGGEDGMHADRDIDPDELTNISF